MTGPATTLNPVQAKDAARANVRAWKALLDRVLLLEQWLRARMHQHAVQAWQAGATQEELQADMRCSRGTVDRVVNPR